MKIYIKEPISNYFPRGEHEPKNNLNEPKPSSSLLLNLKRVESSRAWASSAPLQAYL